MLGAASGTSAEAADLQLLRSRTQRRAASYDTENAGELM
jgi:hypothetical protein